MTRRRSAASAVPAQVEAELEAVIADAQRILDAFRVGFISGALSTREVKILTTATYAAASTLAYAAPSVVEGGAGKTPMRPWDELAVRRASAARRQRAKRGAGTEL